MTPPNFAADAMRDPDAVLDGATFQWNEWQHVGCAEARMRAGMLRQVEQARRVAHTAQSGFGHGLRTPGKRDHRAIVIGIAVAIEHPDAGHGAHGFRERVHFRDVAPFGKIRHAFDKTFH
jgi:hypothetical protein